MQALPVTEKDINNKDDKEEKANKKLKTSSSTEKTEGKDKKLEYRGLKL